MQKLINDPFEVVDEMVDGLLAAFPTQLEVTPSRRGVIMPCIRGASGWSPVEARGTSLRSSATSGLVLPTALQSETSSRLHRRLRS